MWHSLLQMKETVTEDLLAELAKIPTLRQLHLGNAELSQEALLAFWRNSSRELEKFILEHAQLDSGCFSALRFYDSLTALGLTECQQVRGYSFV